MGGGARLHHNGEIIGYRVVARASGEDDRVVNVDDGAAREVTISGLNSSTLYTVLVAAINSAGVGAVTDINIETTGIPNC